MSEQATEQAKPKAAKRTTKPDSPTKTRKKFKDAQAKAAAKAENSRLFREAQDAELALAKAETEAAVAAQNKGGRPSTYTADLAERFCAEIAMGVSVRTACKPDDMPSVKTIFNWFSRHPEFLQQYERAQQMRTEAFAEDILDISDDSTNDYMELRNDDGTSYERYNPENVARAKLRVDTRKYLMAKHAPKKYGANDGLSPAVLIAPMIYIPRELPYNAVNQKHEGAIDGDAVQPAQNIPGQEAG